MIVKIVTDCHFSGCETTHFIEVDDNITDEELDELTNDLMFEDIEPQGYWVKSSEEEADEEGYDIE